jgi:hypothetical protein
MKLRIKGASLRLRLTQGEVRALSAGGRVEEQVPFGGGSKLTYRLSRDATADKIAATLSDGVLDIRVPDALARRWCASDEVTLTENQQTGADTLRIVVEKDFACLAPRPDEDEADNFPHPDTGSKTC